MRILLDEQLPRQLGPLLVGCEVRTVQQQSWAGLKNGALLDAAEAAGFGIIVTGDQNLQFQQNLAKRQIGVVVMCGVSNALEDLLPLVPGTLKGHQGRPPRPGDTNRGLTSAAQPRAAFRSKEDILRIGLLKEAI